MTETQQPKPRPARLPGTDPAVLVPGYPTPQDLQNRITNSSSGVMQGGGG